MCAGPAGRMSQEGLDIDDQFFHVTCHVDQSMKEKIERGDYVDLEKLLPKPCTGGKQTNDNKLDLVYRDGQSFFVPAQNEMRINGVCRWEQAFRIYAAIYSQANPTRAAEIWQYVHVINMAASAYIWENVANYDYTFRHLMACHPGRNWAKLYNQMWNISMRDPLQKSQQTQGFRTNPTSQFQNSQQGAGSNGSRPNSANGAPHARKKPDYCWTFNKGFCKDGNKCRFINCCLYCDSPDHGIHVCAKAKKAGISIATATAKQ